MIKETIVVLSGKGGVGKSTVSSNVALSLAKKGYKVGLLDIDIHGPSIPTLFGIETAQIMQTAEGKIIPYLYEGMLEIISVGLMLKDLDEAIVWRGPLKAKVITQFINDVKWGDLDYLVVDCPPGTGDEVLTIVNTVSNVKGALIVTTPQNLAVVDAKKSVNFCKSMKLPILGVIENMAGFTCPHCKKMVPLFKEAGGKKMAETMDVPFLGSLPFDAEIMDSSEDKKPFIEKYAESQTAHLINEMTESLVNK